MVRASLEGLCLLSSHISALTFRLPLVSPSYYLLPPCSILIVPFICPLFPNSRNNSVRCLTFPVPASFNLRPRLPPELRILFGLCPLLLYTKTSVQSMEDAGKDETSEKELLQVRIDAKCFQDALRTFFQPLKTDDPRLDFYTVYKREATEHDVDYVKKYDEDLNTTLIFVCCLPSTLVNNLIRSPGWAVLCS